MPGLASHLLQGTVDCFNAPGSSGHPSWARYRHSSWRDGTWCVGRRRCRLCRSLVPPPFAEPFIQAQPAAPADWVQTLDAMNEASSVVIAINFVQAHGVVLASAKGPVPRLIDAIAGEPITGNWWSHPRANAIYSVLAEVSESDQVLVCRLINGKVTLVHRRLWPALVRLADRFAPQQITQVREEHTPSGRHAMTEVQFPQWVPPDIAQESMALTEREAMRLLERWLPSASKPKSRRKQ